MLNRCCWRCSLRIQSHASPLERWSTSIDHCPTCLGILEDAFIDQVSKQVTEQLRLRPKEKIELRIGVPSVLTMRMFELTRFIQREEGITVVENERESVKEV